MANSTSTTTVVTPRRPESHESGRPSAATRLGAKPTRRARSVKARQTEHAVFHNGDMVLYTCPTPRPWRLLSGTYHGKTYEQIEALCRRDFVKRYCHEPLLTFDGIVVSFRPYHFDHAFFENKVYGPTFSIDRALRVRWIGRALKDPHAGLFSGWVPLSDSYDNNRRVCLVNDYVVIIEFMCGSRQATFVTAFDASPRTSVKIMGGQRWLDPRISGRR